VVRQERRALTVSTTDLDDAVAEARTFVANAEAALAAMPSPHTLPLAVQRAGMEAGAEPVDPRTRVEEIAGVPVRVFEPAQVVGTYLHIHGGGWTMGSNAFQDARLWRFAEECAVRVVSVEYRLAPEHPFPACIDDCVAVARAVADGRTVIGGESAGAHLSALTLTRVRDGFAGANLAYGCYDLGMSDAARAWGDRVLVLSTPIVAWHLDQLLPSVPDDERRAPAVSPLFADLDGMPPALLTVGTDDPLLDDSRRLAARWPGARLSVWEGGFHAFDLMPLRLGELSTHEQLGFVRDCVR
jgi:acetyl esterase/lipase